MTTLSPDARFLAEVAPQGYPQTSSGNVAAASWDFFLRTSSLQGIAYARRLELERLVGEQERTTGKKIKRTLTPQEVNAEYADARQHGRPPLVTLEERAFQHDPEMLMELDRRTNEALRTVEDRYDTAQSRANWWQRNLVGLPVELAAASALDPITWASMMIQPELGALKTVGLKAVAEAALKVGAREAVLGAGFGGLQAGLVEDRLRQAGVRAPTMMEGAAFGALAGLGLGALAGAAGGVARGLREHFGTREVQRVAEIVSDTVETVRRDLDLAETDAVRVVRANADEAVRAARTGERPRIPQGRDAPSPRPVAPTFTAQAEKALTRQRTLAVLAPGEVDSGITALEAFVKKLKGGADRAELERAWKALPEEIRLSVAAEKAVADATPPADRQARAVANARKLAVFNEAVVERELRDTAGVPATEARAAADYVAQRGRSIRAAEDRIAAALAKAPEPVDPASFLTDLRAAAERKVAPLEAAPEVARGTDRRDVGRSRPSGPVTPESMTARNAFVKSEIERAVADGSVTADTRVFFDGEELRVDDVLRQVEAGDEVAQALRACALGESGPTEPAASSPKRVPLEEHAKGLTTGQLTPADAVAVQGEAGLGDVPGSAYVFPSGEIRQVTGTTNPNVTDHASFHELLTSQAEQAGFKPGETQNYLNSLVELTLYKGEVGARVGPNATEAQRRTLGRIKKLAKGYTEE